MISETCEETDSSLLLSNFLRTTSETGSPVYRKPPAFDFFSFSFSLSFCFSLDFLSLPVGGTGFVDSTGWVELSAIGTCQPSNCETPSRSPTFSTVEENSDLLLEMVLEADVSPATELQ